MLPTKISVADPGSIFRSTYASFIFSHKSGLLEAGARVHIPVTFNPMNVGMYSQHWEIEVKSEFEISNLEGLASLNSWSFLLRSLEKVSISDEFTWK